MLPRGNIAGIDESLYPNMSVLSVYSSSCRIILIYKIQVLFSEAF